jgi:hypothetical protein
MGTPVIVPRKGIARMTPWLGARLGGAPFDPAMNSHFIRGCRFERFASEPGPLQAG